ncbi:MAG: glycosyltransferase [Patescibacteria group bacterium]|nr:glycosyltransferase [Patescibacteria group bacterium]
MGGQKSPRGKSQSCMILAFIVVLGASVLIPGPTIVILAMNTGAVFILSALQVFSAIFPRSRPNRRNTTSRAFVSVVVPTYNEPPALLMRTLDALSRLDHKDFEALIIDNNTKDPRIWRPVESYAQRLGHKFRFFHVENLPGFKAGALNYVLRFASPRSEYVAVIDADYEVKPEFLTEALSYFIDKDIALVQFPQQYRNCTKANQPISDEYRHFFKIYMNMANHMDAVPSTGTVSVYTLEALRHIGGFSENALTEDADAGLRLYAAGYRGVYADHSIGYGLMPYDVEAYRKQKSRWASGNAQSIRTLLGLYGKIPLRSWIGFLANLTAWDHLNFLPFAALAAYTVVLLPFVPTTALHRELLTVASFSIFTTLASKFAIFTVALRGQKNGLRRAFKAFIVHMGMTLLYSESLGAAFWGTKRGFERTNKFILSKMPSLLKNSYRELILGIWFAAGVIEAAMWGTRPITTIALLASSLILFSVYYVALKIAPTKIYSKKILANLEQEYEPHLAAKNA